MLTSCVSRKDLQTIGLESKSPPTVYSFVPPISNDKFLSV